ncbi:xanthine dehydrogenase family protein subunit M [Dactylosporangium aurantiacum]|uniref:Xanthine dehydrogenase family protein subunit M n=1 Tax=Dactylosporangium aurantiacum TaxID=35754 RepID=A0A9Q9MEA1_9ACTN|nr:xanthine dehydrogenase family protein subunit M [Dactylosporangium aurantiacum]MDG6102722.1 xanthine dehydrogenase family protein subunit M [Dactylosporangium aurantiacum]UWZ53034.1 xanthine dehydrogenase family protein subunit M [Dactylosporangium aurantiacum]
MKPFAYRRADAPDSAVATVGHAGAVFLAGGTNLVDLMKLGVTAPEMLVDVTGLPLRQIEALPDGGMRIGALTTNSDLAADPVLRTRFPAVALALLSGASAQLRNRATVGGNLLQRTRCRYFVDVTKACNKRRLGAGCDARDGEHRDLAIFGTETPGGPAPCVATNPSDLAVALVLLDARVELLTPHGTADMSVHELFRLPGDRPDRDTNLPPGALITAVVLPAAPIARTSTYRKVRDRSSFAFATGSVAAALDVADGTVRDVRLAYGAVAHRPWRAYAAERALRGAPATVDSFERAADEELATARPLRDNGYKVPLMRNLTVGVLRGMTEASW